MENNSTLAENATLTIKLEQNKPFSTGSFSMPPHQNSGKLNATWDTSGYTPRAYAIIVSVISVISSQPVGNTYLRTQNITSGNVESFFVILIPSVVTGSLSLSLIQTTGLGILIIAAAVFAVTRLARKPSYTLEPLEG